MEDARTGPAAARARLVDVLLRVGGEDRAALNELYALTSAKLFGICVRICRDRQAAEDVLQEVYLLIWRRAGAFDPGRASPITWLATIARNRAIDWRRANPDRATLAIEEALSIPDTSASASDLMVSEEASRHLHACLDELDERQRGAIHTAFFDGLSYSEIARRQAVPLGTMKSWVRRGLAKLRECLDRV